jgi:bifunctional enzyme CysN/CysC
LTTETNKQQVDRHDVAECVLETLRPIAFDPAALVRETGRFVVVDGHDIAAAGVVLENLAERTSTIGDHVRDREFGWIPSAIAATQRALAYGHGAKFVVFTGSDAERLESLAGALERRLFQSGCKAYCLRLSNVVRGLDADLITEDDTRDEHLRRLGELARILTDAGQIFITAVPAADDSDLKVLEALNHPNEIVFVHIGEGGSADLPAAVHLPADVDAGACVNATCDLLRERNVLLDYHI